MTLTTEIKVPRRRHEHYVYCVQNYLAVEHPALPFAAGGISDSSDDEAGSTGVDAAEYEDDSIHTFEGHQGGQAVEFA